MKPAVSVITSFSALGLQDAARRLNNYSGSADCVEVYAFMQPDMSWLFDSLPGHKSVHDALACARGRRGCAEDVAKKIHECFQGRKIVAMATFLPEIMSHDRRSVIYGNTVDALCFLIETCRELQKLRHPVATLELVAGCSLAGVWYGRLSSACCHGPEATFVLNRLSDSEAFGRLLRRIEPVAVCAGKAPKIALALEMEPGPLFTIGEPRKIVALCDMLARSGNEDVAGCVGLNLDIAHWAFIGKGINASWIYDNPVVYRRIVHAHISDHAKGHFGDGAVASMNPEAAYAPWIQLLGELPRRADGGLGYSGYVSCELECCPDDELVRSSVSTVDRLIQTLC